MTHLQFEQYAYLDSQQAPPREQVLNLAANQEE
jgi:hypothetical protein